MGKKSNDLKSLDKLKNIFNDSVQELAEETLFEIEQTYESAIDMFYSDYDPLYYNRTYSTYEASSGYDYLFSSENLKKNGDIFDVGINIGKENLDGNPYNAKDADWVINRTLKGIHGLNAGSAFGKSRSRNFRRIKGKKSFETIWRDRHGSVTKKRAYYEGKVQVMDRIMQNMSPSPRAIMNREFKRLTSRRNMKAKFNDIFERNMNEVF